MTAAVRPRRSPYDPERTVVKVREPRPKAEPSDEVQSIKGSTRLEAKKQRRREGREQGRRPGADLSPSRVPGSPRGRRARHGGCASTATVRRSASWRTAVLVEHYVNKEQATSVLSANVYLGKVQNVLPVDGGMALSSTSARAATPCCTPARSTIEAARHVGRDRAASSPR
ncbi:hypothetical protein GCM10023238_28620 [Streptomyces heliomycini]